jgi:hypothetical protein
MLLLAATLLFFPHYEITRAPDVTASLFSAAGGEIRKFGLCWPRNRS